MPKHFAHGFLLVNVCVDAVKRGKAEQVLEVLGHLQLRPLAAQEVVGDGSPIGEGGRNGWEKLNGGARWFGSLFRRECGRGGWEKLNGGARWYGSLFRRE